MSIYRSPTRRDFDPNLTQPTQSGIYFVASDDLARLARTASREDLRVCRTDLADCQSKQELLQRLTESLELPPTFGDNWDALADALRDLRWIPAWGYTLLFDHADDLRRSSPADFEILLGILDDAATFASDNDMPWFAFLALPDAAEDAGG